MGTQCGMTGLIISGDMGYYEVVEYLLSAGADVHIQWVRFAPGLQSPPQPPDMWDVLTHCNRLVAQEL